jgi:hypothetical protein
MPRPRQRKLEPQDEQVMNSGSEFHEVDDDVQGSDLIAEKPARPEVRQAPASPTIFEEKAPRRRLFGGSTRKRPVEEKALAEQFPHLRTSYSLWYAVLVWFVLTGMLVFIARLFSLEGTSLLIGFVAVTLITMLWWHDSIGELRDRIPPKGWKAEIEALYLCFITPEEFDGMRFELTGNAGDGIEDHAPPRAMRYSRDIFLWMRLLLVAGALSPLGVLVLSHLTLDDGPGGLPQAHDIRWVWLVLSAICLAAAGLMRLDWDYRRLMYDSDMLYLLKENPAWLPWWPGQNDVIRMDWVYSADPIDTSWGKRWGHGTIVLSYQKQFGADRTIHLKRIPNHRKVCNDINGLANGGGVAMLSRLV